MKKIVYSVGLLSTISIVIGTVLRATLGTNANGDVNRLLIALGFGGLALVFIPGLLSSTSSDQKSSGEKMRLRILLLSTILLSVGWILKFFHVASANELVMLGAIIFTLGFLPSLFLKMYRESTS